MTPELIRLCQTYGVIWRYKDGAGQECQAPRETCLAILQAMGVDIEASPELPQTRIVEVDVTSEIAFSGQQREWNLILEDGQVLDGFIADGVAKLPPLPMGVHMLAVGDQCFTLICAPKKLALPLRGWGVTAPLYGLNARDGAVGHYGDLGELAQVCAAKGAGFIGINPVHAGFPHDAAAYSPYAPSSRTRLNIRHIDVGVRGSADNMALIDYRAFDLDHAEALETAFQQDFDRVAFEAFVEEGGESLHSFALHQALSEVHGPYWSDWPKAFQNPHSEEVQSFAQENKARLAFFLWQQWRASDQLDGAQQKALTAGMAHGLYLDLAVGTHPHGAETWVENQSESATFAQGVSLGSPADAFSASGQNWGLTPLNPLALKKLHYAPFIETLRAQLRYAGILRIDHALGFERSFWIPDGLPGAYVAMPRAALFALVRIEAVRAGAIIVGEDLGNVPDGLREEMAKSGILGCRVAMFERNWKTDRAFVAAREYSVSALASLSTHDLPTLRGWWAGQDIDWRQKLGESAPEQAEAQQRERAQESADFKQNLDKDVGPGIAAHRFLASTSSVLAAVQIEDILELVEQPNLPGTIDSHPNWRRTLPLSVNEIGDLPMMEQLSCEMAAQER